MHAKAKTGEPTSTPRENMFIPHPAAVSPKSALIDVTIAIVISIETADANPPRIFMKLVFYSLKKFAFYISAV